MKRLHKWPSLVISLLILLWAVSGIILNHRYTFSHIDVNRKLLPREHHYRNWNNAALRSSVRLDSNYVIYYGNVGAWGYDENTGNWRDFRNGLPHGADHHRINAMILTSGGRLYCGTRFSLYQFNMERSEWMSIAIPHHNSQVVDLAEINDSLWVLTRSHLWKVPLEEDPVLTFAEIPARMGYDNKVGLFKTLWVIHSGEIYGIAGRLIVDLVALIFIFLTVSGLIYFFFPGIIKRRKRKERPVKRLLWWNKYSIKWHNKIGIWLVAVLLLTTITGMFLRPPLLIAIASGRVGKIPFSVLDDGNPWYDQLRRILYDESSGQVFLATSEGIFITDTQLKRSPEYIHPQPPASVMGYNVFTPHSEGHILIGSFSGLYLLNPVSGAIYNHMTGNPHVVTDGPVNPVGEYMIAGYHKDLYGNEYVFDYNAGAMAAWHIGEFLPMPPEIAECRMPLWNVALEMHTARLFKPMLGDFYILVIPLFGLSILLILISGTVLWIRKYRRRK